MAEARPGAPAGPLSDRIAAACRTDAPAMIGPHGRLTYGELLDRSRALAALLTPRRSPVLVYGHKEPAMLVAFVAAARAGRAYVPVDPSSPPARVARIIEVARPDDAIFARAAPPALTASLHACGIEPIALDPLGANAVDDDAADIRVTPDAEAPAYIVFTSGTTGGPKGVPIPHRALDHFTAWLTTATGLGRDEVVLDQAPFTFDLSVMSLYAALLTGGALFSATADDVADPRALFERLDGAALTTWVSTPSFARLCAAEPRFRRSMLPRLRRFLFCGETLPPGLARELMERFPGAAVWNTYGPTETTVAVTGIRIDEGMASTDRPLPIGRAFPGMDVWIADPADPARTVADGTEGEIVIAGPQLALGYLGPERSSQGFVTSHDGRSLYRTGDIGHLDPADGLLYCGGRLDRQIKLHGYRVELEEIESQLRRVTGIADATVLTVDRDRRPDHLVAFVVADPAAGPLPIGDLRFTRLVREVLAERLPAYALPRSVRRVAALPLTSNGKVDRVALRGLLP